MNVLLTFLVNHRPELIIFFFQTPHCSDLIGLLALFNLVTESLVFQNRLVVEIETQLAVSCHTAISLVNFTPNAYLISRKSIAELTVLLSNC